MAATEKWTERRGATQQILPDGRVIWTAEIVFQVTDADTSRDAVAQIPFEPGSDHDEYGSELKANLFDPQKRGFRFWEVRVGFSSDAPDAGGNVNTKARIRWTRNVVTEEVDRDFDGRPIVNSVGDPPLNTPTRDFFDLVLAYTRYEPTYNLRKSIDYVGAYNEDNFSISFGGGPFNGSGGIFNENSPLAVFGGECLCTAMEPTGDYEEGQSLVQVGYEFRLRARIILTESTWISGFDWRFMDQGSRGLYDSTLEGDIKLLPFYNADGEPITEPVRLNGFGVPYLPDITVGKRMTTPLGKSQSPAGSVRDDRYADSEPPAMFLSYRRHDRKPFAGLIPLFK